MARIAGFTIISTILLTAMVDSVLGIDNQSEKEQEGESDNQKMEDKQDVDIAKFYSKREVIWIISVSNTQFPCKVDFVSDANGTHTLFTRHHREGVRFPKRDLIGEFRTEAREAQNGLNAMQVSPQRENARRDNNVGSWRSLEVMEHESSSRTCAFFPLKYSEQPTVASGRVSRARTRATSRGTNTEYDIRIKNSNGESSMAKTCFEELKSGLKSVNMNQDLQLEQMFNSCKAACRSTVGCSDLLGRAAGGKLCILNKKLLTLCQFSL
uniref:Putative lipocalin n=1 Tax=Rhipicephalus microplus TaxID=6941 RepID=A0A6G5A4D5_RHIMP